MTQEPHPCGKCSFFQRSLWRPVAGGARATLTRSFTRREVETGGVVFHQGAPSDGVYCISKGLIAIRSFAPDGSSSLLRLAYPGELIGYRAFMTGRDHRTEAQAVLPSRVCIVAQRDAKQVVQACPEVLARLGVRCADELDRCHDRIHDAARVSNKARLAQVLDRLMAAHGAATGGAISDQQGGADRITWRMRLPISRQDLADILGVQPETLSRLMTRLEQDGAMRASGRWIEMPFPPQKRAV